jgi:hypothetical protein
LFSESGIDFAKYFTFSTAASVSASSGFFSEMPVGCEPDGSVGSETVGSELGVIVVVDVDDIPSP